MIEKSFFFNLEYIKYNTASTVSEGNIFILRKNCRTRDFSRRFRKNRTKIRPRREHTECTFLSKRETSHKGDNSSQAIILHYFHAADPMLRLASRARAFVSNGTRVIIIPFANCRELIMRVVLRSRSRAEHERVFEPSCGFHWNFTSFHRKMSSIFPRWIRRTPDVVNLKV